MFANQKIFLTWFLNQNSSELVAYAQNAEDIVLYRAFKNENPGFYVDVGAGDPIIGSTTKNLIDKLNWTGIDIEPQVKLANLLRKGHPRSIVITFAVGTANKSQTFYRLKNNWGMSTINADVAVRHRKSGWSVVEETVVVKPLDDILYANKVSRIDLLKIDVEGAELDVLKSINLKHWKPRVILAEATAPASNLQTHELWEPIILDAGYKLCLFDGLNRFYARKEELELIKQLEIPANVFDRYRPLRFWELLSEKLKLPY